MPIKPGLVFLDIQKAGNVEWFAWPWPFGLLTGMAFDPNAPQSSPRPRRPGLVGRLGQPAREAQSLFDAHEPPLYCPS